MVSSLGSASLSFIAFAKARGAAQKIFTMIEQAGGLEKHDDNKGKVVDLQGRIEFKDVDFCYPSRPDMPVLQSFSIEVEQGKTVALVGSTGSGKSTVVALLERFYEPKAGRILLDGHDISSLQLKSLRLQLGLVSQEPSLFATSIKENIQMGKKSATFEEIELAAKSSNAHDFIQQLPNGYDTQVGEKGIQLSGGQKQRIAIARAVLRNPPILLLDEATSALDSSSEKVVQDALDQFMMGRTAIVIAHRLSTIQNVGTILVLEKGRLIETGTHKELLSKGENGVYYKLVKLQEMTLGVLAEPKFLRSSSTPKSTPRRSTPRVHQVSLSTSQALAALSFDSRRSFSMSIEMSEVRPTTDPEQNHKSRGSYFWTLAKYNMSEWPRALIGSLGCIITGLAHPLAFFILACVIVAYYDPDHHHGSRQVGLYAKYYILIAVAGMIGYTLQEYFWGCVNDELIKRVRELMLSAILRNEIGWFDKEENSSSQLSARLALDAANVRNALGARISLLIHNLMILAVSSIISFSLSWKMALIALAVFPMSILSNVVEKTMLTGATAEMEHAHQKANTVAGEAVANIRTIAAFNTEDRILSSFEKELHDIKRQSLRRGLISGLSVGAATFFRFCGNAIVLWSGLYLVTHKGEDPFKVIKVFLVIVAAAYAIGNAISLVPDLLKSGIALASIFQILRRPSLIDPDNKNAIVVEKVKGDIELKNVGFHYPTRPEVPVFSILNLQVAAGTSLALVGPSGCGKSTIVGLLQRFYEPTKGRVMVDGVDIRSYNLKSLRKHIGLVQQEPVLFATTIYDNIVYGCETATTAEVEAAARAANAHDFISTLPEGYKTFAGERGSQLSGGQKQRIAIARAVLKNPAILLLDEATSALDAEAEKVVQQALDKVMEGRTVIVIAHRLSTIRNVNTIAVLQDGTVVEQGSHASLLSKPSGAYSRLVSLQNQRAGEAEQP